MLLAALTLLTAQASPNKILWQIGKADGFDSEFALAPGAYEKYDRDPAYLIGTSTEKDWPYVLPGPADSWAQGRSHRDEIYFGLENSNGQPAHLTIDFVDTQASTPPTLQLLVNGKQIATWQAPAGAGDDVVLGKSTKGKACHWSTTIPANALNDGNNSIAIVNSRGSWAVFDDVRFETAVGVNLIPVKSEITMQGLPERQAILRTPHVPRQPIDLEIMNLGPAAEGKLSAPGAKAMSIDLKPGRQQVTMQIPPVKSKKDFPFHLSAGSLRSTTTVTVKPVRPWEIYLFPHSHVDIGYTNLQPYLLAMHERNLLDAIQVAKENENNPDDSQFHFNVEATWVLDRFMQTATPEQKQAVQKALQDHTLAVSAGYANLLTGIMHPEEQMQSFRYSRILQDQLKTTFDTASQTDVPGMTWGNIVAMNEAGVKSMVLMPNPVDRIGGVRKEWEDTPFFWDRPSDASSTLIWETDTYAVGTIAGWNGERDHIYRTQDPSGRFIQSYIFPKLDRLVEKSYPYTMVGVPWSMTDNPPVDADIPVAAKAWNEKYVYPHVVLSTLSDACKELVKRYKSIIPHRTGDLTPYWEDGAGSTAAETAINRLTPDHLIQAETLFAMNRGEGYPVQDFLEAWRNVILFSEHTWGAYNSISEPDDKTAKAEWAIKQGFALKANDLANQLMAKSVAAGITTQSVTVSNTNSWPRTDLVRISPQLSKAGDRALDEHGSDLPSQRLKNGELAVLVRDVPPLSSVRVTITPGPAFSRAVVRANVAGITSPELSLKLDSSSGQIASLVDIKTGKELIGSQSTYRPNQYLYLPGTDLKKLSTIANPHIKVIEPGPLVACLEIDGDAAGTKGIQQTITVVAGIDRVFLSNKLDKLAVREKEGVHFAFPYAVPEGKVRVSLPWTVIEPEKDQLPGSNKNWLTTEGFVDISNDDFGVTTAALDAPLIEIGEISANLLGSVANPADWRQHIGATQTFFSWALNNHWHTNYKADQEGPLTFRYVVQPHEAYRPEEAAKFGMEVRQPLIVSRELKQQDPLLEVSDPSVLVTRAVPTDDGKGMMIRLWGASGLTKKVRLKWRSDIDSVTRSDLSQHAIGKIGNTVEVPGWGVVTLRFEWKQIVK